jgi:putative salt-induced outer membrane protein YdiY
VAKSDFAVTGQLNIGLKRERGNTDEDKYHVDSESILRWPDDRILIAFDGEFEQIQGDDTKQELDLVGTYDHFLDEKRSVFGLLAFEHDRFADLDLRKTIATGFAYQIFEDARTNLSIKAGPGYVWEDFSKDLGKDNFVGIWALRLTHILDRK